MTLVPSDWKTVRLEEVAEIRTGLAKGKAYSQATVKVPYLRVANVQDGYLDLSEIKEIEVLPSEVERYSLKFGDVLLTEGGDFDKLGRGDVWRGEISPCLHQNHVFAVRTKPEILDPFFFAYQSASPYGKAYFLSVAKQTTNLASINSTQLKDFPVLLPPLPEQRAIAAILSTWDDAIALTARLIDALKRRKQALMQRLLTGQTRFPEFICSEETQETILGSIPADWRYVPIGAVAQQSSERNADGIALPVLSCTKYDGLVDSLEYFGRQIFSDDLSTYKIVRRGSFAYATNHIEEGSIGYQDLYDAGLISPMYTAFTTNDKINDSFLYKLLKTELYRQIFEYSTNSSVNRRGSLRWTEFSQIHVPLPDLQEQDAIAAVLDEHEMLIRFHENYLDALQTQKRGLMQRLLTGQVRVLPPAAE